MRQVALLRGINVGGVKIPMTDIVTLMESLGHSEVRTVLATGNIIFTPTPTGQSGSALQSAITSALAQAFSYHGQLILVPLDQLVLIVDGYPFDDSDSSMQPYVVFGQSQEVLADLATIRPQLVICALYEESLPPKHSGVSTPETTGHCGRMLLETLILDLCDSPARSVKICQPGSTGQD